MKTILILVAGLLISSVANATPAGCECKFNYGTNRYMQYCWNSTPDGMEGYWSGIPCYRGGTLSADEATTEAAAEPRPTSPTFSAEGRFSRWDHPDYGWQVGLTLKNGQELSIVHDRVSLNLGRCYESGHGEVCVCEQGRYLLTKASNGYEYFILKAVCK